MRVFVAGGTGLVGTLLVKKLRERGDHVVVLSRRPEIAKQMFGDNLTVVVGDPVYPGAWMDEVRASDAVVNLAGEGIFNRRWSQEFKDLIRSSRLKSTENIVTAMGKSPMADSPGSPQRTLINASAIGYYGPHGDEELTEAALPGNDFLAKVCTEWENTALAAERFGIRVVLLRTGIVLDKAGGALAKMLTPFKLFVGGPIGSGRQYMSWIHIEDEVGLILFVLDHSEIRGPINATAPIPATNRDLSKKLGMVLGRPSFFPTPGFMLRVMLGESAQLITQGQRVRPEKALTAGYIFKFGELEPALRDLLGGN